MKYLVMCEGPNELEIIRILLRHNCLWFNSDDLLNLVPYHARQISSSTVVQTALNLYKGEVRVLRIGDSLSEKLVIPSKYKTQIISIDKYCTKPELEMLLIIAENLVNEYEKEKSFKKPKLFAKENIKMGKIKYNNSTSFYADYFGNNIKLLIWCIRKYKEIKGSHKKDELYLADLLR